MTEQLSVERLQSHIESLQEQSRDDAILIEAQQDRIADLECRAADDILAMSNFLATNMRLAAELHEAGQNLHGVAMTVGVSTHSGRFEQCPSAFCRRVRDALKGKP